MTENAGPATRTVVLAVVILLAVFCAGAAAGVFVDRTLSPARPLRTARAPAAMFAPGGRVAERLALTPEQSRAIEEIVAAHREKVRTDATALTQRVVARLDSMQTAVQAVLTPEQRAELPRLQEELGDRFPARFGRPRPRGQRLRELRTPAAP